MLLFDFDVQHLYDLVEACNSIGGIITKESDAIMADPASTILLRDLTSTLSYVLNQFLSNQLFF